MAHIEIVESGRGIPEHVVYNSKGEVRARCESALFAQGMLETADDAPFVPKAKQKRASKPKPASKPKRVQPIEVAEVLTAPEAWQRKHGKNMNGWKKPAVAPKIEYTPSAENVDKASRDELDDVRAIIRVMANTSREYPSDPVIKKFHGKPVAVVHRAGAESKIFEIRRDANGAMSVVEIQ